MWLLPFPSPRAELFHRSRRASVLTDLPHCAPILVERCAAMSTLAEVRLESIVPSEAGRIGGRTWWAHVEFIQRVARALGLIRFRGHFPKGGYDVHDGRQATEAYASDFR
jgi:hypothetical protein